MTLKVDCETCHKCKCGDPKCGFKCVCVKPDDDRTKPAWIGDDIAAQLRVSEEVRPLQQLHAALSAMRDNAVPNAHFDLAAKLRDAKNEVGKLIEVAKGPLRGESADGERTKLAKELGKVTPHLNPNDLWGIATHCILREKRAVLEALRVDRCLNGTCQRCESCIMRIVLVTDISGLERERNRDGKTQS